MKKTLLTVFSLLVTLVLAGKILNWILKFSPPINQTLNVAMFSLIGTAYLVMGYAWENRIQKLVITASGIFLIVMNFFGPHTLVDIAGILCLVTPLLLARFYKVKQEDSTS
jgi:hypothetical protein